MNQTGSSKNRTLLWEELAPTEDQRTSQREYPAQPGGGFAPATRPRLGFARRASENLEPANAPEPIDLEESDDDADDFRPHRPWWRPRTKEGRILLLSAATLSLVALAVAGYLLRRHILADPDFVLAASSDVQVTGASDLSRNQLLPVFTQDIGKNLLTVPIGERRRQLEQVSWVERATVMRVLPNQIRVNVVERTPIAFVRQTADDPRVGLVDAGGVLLTMPAELMAQHHYSFPVVTGIDARDPLAERQKRMAVYQRLVRELDSGPTRLSAQISEIDLRDASDARVLMPEPGGDILAHFGADHFLERFQTYEQHIGEWRQQYPRLATVDLRYDQQVILRQGDQQTGASQPQGGSEVLKGDGQAASPVLTATSQKPVSQAAAPPETVKKNVAVEKPRDRAAKAQKKNAAAKGKVKKPAAKKKPAVKRAVGKPSTHTQSSTGE